METKAKRILGFLKDNGCDYADIRMHLLDQTEKISTLNDDIDGFDTGSSKGYGIRVLYNGAWGFSSSENFSDLKTTATLALEKAKSASGLIQEKVTLAPSKPNSGLFVSPCEIDPFSVPVKEKIERLLEISKKMKDSRFTYWIVHNFFNKKHILYFNTDGSEIEKKIIDVSGGLVILANDKDKLQQRRSYGLYNDAFGTRGYESILSDKYFDQSTRIKEECIELLSAPKCTEEKCDVILLNEMMTLQTHETIGHALELDRILGYELSYAGGSHVDLNNFGELQFGSQKLTARADGTVPNSPGSTGFDDDGVEGKNVTLIDKGILKNAITSRQMIVEANRKAGKEIFKSSGGACRAESYNKLPIERMNNINVDPGTDGTVEDIIKNTKNGIILETPRSWSIGSNRENFHFATEIGWKVIDGKIDHMVKNATYGGDSIPFWNSLDLVGDKSTWQMQQTFHCGKGQPNQIMRLGHGVPVCRFKNVQVGK